MVGAKVIEKMKSDNNEKPHWPTKPSTRILYFLAFHEGKWCTWGPAINGWSVQGCLPVGTSEKAQLRFMQTLQKKGLVSGCDCGCRGDYTVTTEGLDFLAKDCIQGEYIAEEYRDGEFGYGY